SNLLIMVIIGGYETFVSRLNLEGHPDQPEWLSHVNASVLKVKLATAIIGISPDPSAKQRKFADKYQLPFPLLADVDHVVAEKYGVWKQKSMYGRTYMGIERSAFLIGTSGKIEQAWYKVSPKDTPVNLLKALGR
ncbi:MAG: YqhA family protein, partial [Ilumatobacteraceae bacterium]